MKKIIFILSIVCIYGLILAGCSSAGSGTPTTPNELSHMPMGQTTHHTWGLWQFTADPANETLDVIRLRTGNLHLNALPFLEPPPLVNLTLESVVFNGRIIEADIGLKHPFSGFMEFTGFDVCGVFITDGGITGFNDPDLRMAGEGDARLLNPDGYTRWWNPAEFPHGGTMFSYQDGLLGAPDSLADYNSTLNGYKYFCDDLDEDDPLTDVNLVNRGMFSAGTKNVRHYSIDMGTAGLIFNYAVDACWAFPSGDPPWTAPGDFPAGANRPEAWRIEVAEVQNTLWNDGAASGGGLSLSIDVYDWYDADMNTITVESPGNLTPAESSVPTGGGEGYQTYEVDILNATPSEGSIDLLISAASETVGYGGLLPGKPVTSYFTYTADVGTQSPYTPGWARTWGGLETDRGFGVAVDGFGIYVTGTFTDVVDFDPGTGVEEYTSNGGDDIFLSKFDSLGDFQWACTWGGIYLDQGRAIAVDNSGNVYVTGPFEGTVDFDPGAGTDNHSSVDASDVFLSKFDSSGVFQWARTWGSTWPDSGRGVGVDASGNIYVSGYFRDTADFDPGTGSDSHSSNGNNDVFLSKFDSSGTFQWARTWGGTGNDQNRGLAVDGAGNCYVAGFFAVTVDFDPGSGTVSHTSNGMGDAFLSKFNSSGTFQWVGAWGGTLYEEAWAVTYGGSEDIYVTGWFGDTVDFDPGTGTENHTSNGADDAFISKFDPSGAFQWARTWGGFSFDTGYGVAVNGYGDVLVSGKFWDVVDFDPGTGVDNRTSNGGNDAYLSKLDPSGNYVWANTWGGSGNDEDHGTAVDGYGNIYTTGQFSETVDFAPPGDGPDLHVSEGSIDAFLCKFLPGGSW